MTFDKLKLLYVFRFVYCVILFTLVYLYYPLPDFELYSSGSQGVDLLEGSDRTAITKNIFFYTSKVFFNNSWITNIFFIFVTNYLLYKVNKECVGYFKTVSLFLGFILPSVAIWTSSYSKEMLFMIVLLLNLLVLFKVSNSIRKILFISCFLYLAAILRFQYIPILILINIFYLIKNKDFKKFVLFIGVISILMIPFFLSPYIKELMDNIYNYFFFYEGRSNRHWVNWKTELDFYFNIPLAYYTSFFKFTFSEIYKTPILFIFFIEGLLILKIIYNCFINLKKEYRFAFIYIFIYSLTITFPLNIFNPGSAMRYSSIIFVITFITAVAFSKSFNIKSKIKKI